MCVWGFCESCKHRDEKNVEISQERSDTEGKQAHGEIRPGPLMVGRG